MYKSLIKELEYIPLKEKRAEEILDRVVFWFGAVMVIAVLVAVIVAPKIV